MVSHRLIEVSYQGGLAIMRLSMVVVSAFLMVFAMVSWAQSQDKVYRIGVLSPMEGRNPADDALETRLAALGWVKGRNVALSYRYSKVNDGLPELANTLVHERVDIIVTSGTPASLAARQATTSIPIVFYSVGDPVGVGLISSLARPGGNVTGISGITYQLGAKRLELLNQVLTDARLIGVLLNRTDPTASQILAALNAGLGANRMTVKAFYAARPAEIEAAFQAMKRLNVNGVVIQPDGMFWAQRSNIVKFAADLRLPTMYAFQEDVEAGGLMSYGANFLGMQAQAVGYVDRILRGSLPAGLPVQEATKLELTINVKAAKMLGLTIPPSLLLRADRTIE